MRMRRAADGIGQQQRPAGAEVRVAGLQRGLIVGRKIIRDGERAGCGGKFYKAVAVIAAVGVLAERAVVDKEGDESEAGVVGGPGRWRPE